MKTADLIPLLLIELNESDKYGFELTKNIETKSNGKIIIKQPTLYTLLKKLEKSKFISSYWQDSDIGGKRHYYKITENGKLQLSTLPSYSELLNYILSDNNDENLINEPAVEVDIKSTPAPTPVETVLPSEEVFVNDSIDTQTQTEINQNNIDLLKTSNLSTDEEFATNSQVSKFVDVTTINTPEIKLPQQAEKTDLLNLDVKLNIQQNDVEFVDYVNLKKSKEYQTAKKFSKLTILKTSFVSLFMLLMIISSVLLANKFGTSILFYSSLILSSFVLVFYPVLTAICIDVLKKKNEKNNYKFNMKKSLFFKSAIFCFILLIVLVVNISIGQSTFSAILNIRNFPNFYFPIILSMSLYIDSILGYIVSYEITK